MQLQRDMECAPADRAPRNTDLIIAESLRTKNGTHKTGTQAGSRHTKKNRARSPVF